jgi:hypothetical protein
VIRPATRNRFEPFNAAVVARGDNLMSKRATFAEGRPPRRSPRARRSGLWQEIILGLGIAAIGIVMAVSVVRVVSPQPERLQHPPADALTLQFDPGATVIRPFSSPQL